MTYIIALCALFVGGCIGFLGSSILRAVSDRTPERPEALTRTPEEIVAVYEARREGEKRNNPPASLPPLQRGIKGDLEKWEREQDKIEKKRRARS